MGDVIVYLSGKFYKPEPNTMPLHDTLIILLPQAKGPLKLQKIREEN